MVDNIHAEEEIEWDLQLDFEDDFDMMKICPSY